MEQLRPLEETVTRKAQKTTAGRGWCTPAGLPIRTDADPPQESLRPLHGRRSQDPCRPPLVI